MLKYSSCERGTQRFTRLVAALHSAPLGSALVRPVSSCSRGLTDGNVLLLFIMLLRIALMHSSQWVIMLLMWSDQWNSYHWSDIIFILGNGNLMMTAALPVARVVLHLFVWCNFIPIILSLQDNMRPVVCPPLTCRSRTGTDAVFHGLECHQLRHYMSPFLAAMADCII